MALRFSIGAAIFFIAVAFTMSFYQGTTRASGVNPQCVGGWDTSCPCGTVKSEHGCTGGNNKYMCACQETSNGFTAAGKCFAPGECHAQSTSDSAGPDAGLKDLLGMLQQLMQQMQQGGGGGGDTGSTDPCAPQPSTGSSTKSNVPSWCGGYNPYTNNSPINPFDTSSLFDSLGSSSTDLISGSDNSNSNTDTNTVNSLSDGKITSGLTASTSTVTSGTIVPGGSTANTPTQPPFGSVNGTSGDIRLQGTKATVLVSNRDVSRNSQISGLYGFTVAPGVAATTMFKSLCGLRIWSSGYLLSIIPSTYFDGLCTARGYALGARITASSAQSSSAPKAVVPLASKPAASTTPAKPVVPQYLGELRADIWATPTSVSSGSRTSIFWEAKGALSCSVKSSDGNFTGSSLSGHASTLPITQNTTFTITCMSATSTISNQVVVAVQ